MASIRNHFPKRLRQSFPYIHHCRPVHVRALTRQTLAFSAGGNLLFWRRIAAHRGISRSSEDDTSKHFAWIRHRELHSAIEGGLMGNDIALLDSRSPEWVQVKDAGIAEVNGLYRRASGWAPTQEQETLRKVASEPSEKPQGQQTQGMSSNCEADDSDDEQFRLLMQGELMPELGALEEGTTPYPFALMCWQNGKYTMLLEPWGLPEPGGGIVRSRRFVIFADAHGVSGWEPYYQAFQIEETADEEGVGSNSGWAWMVGPSGVWPPPSVQPFSWEGGFAPS